MIHIFILLVSFPLKAPQYLRMQYRRVEFIRNSVYFHVGSCEILFTITANGVDFGFENMQNNVSGEKN